MPIALRWCGAVLLFPAIMLLLWTFRTLGKNLTDTVVTRREHTLVTSGPYRWVRHPFYDSAAMLFTAVSLTTASWFFVVAGVALLSLLVPRTKIEERNLLARFGGAYQKYMDETGRFFPKKL